MWNPRQENEVNIVLCLCVRSCFYRMVQVIVHVGCMSLKDSQELVSFYVDSIGGDVNVWCNAWLTWEVVY